MVLIIRANILPVIEINEGSYFYYYIKRNKAFDSGNCEVITNTAIKNIKVVSNLT